jgi:sulfur relay protein TusB/DsrH
MLSSCCSSPEALKEKLKYITPKSTLLFFQDGVVMLEQPRFADCLTCFKLYAVEPDAYARGITISPKLDVTCIDYSGFVNLTLAHVSVQAW